MQIEIKDELVERLKRLREHFKNKSPVKFDTVGGEINALIEWAIDRDEQKLGLAPKEEEEEVFFVLCNCGIAYLDKKQECPACGLENKPQNREYIGRLGQPIPFEVASAIAESLVEKRKVGGKIDELVEEHNCTEHIEYGEHEFVDGVVFFYGRCKKCGKELVETYRYEDTRDRETDAVMKEKHRCEDNFIFAKLKKVFEYVETRVEKRKGESD